jgi:hypothetical protein
MQPNIKKTIPLTILKFTNRLIEEYQNQSNILVEKPDDCILTLKVTDADFYFTIKSYQTQNDRLAYKICVKPYSEEHLMQQELLRWSSDIESELLSWWKLVNEYDKPYLLFDDNIVESYYNELEPYFDIVDSDANATCFNLKQQEYIINIYEDLIRQILNEKEEENKEEAEYVIKQINIAQNQLSKSTKKQAIDQLRKVAAFCKKYSYKVSISIAAEALVELGKLAIKVIGH